MSPRTSRDASLPRGRGLSGTDPGLAQGCLEGLGHSTNHRRFCRGFRGFQPSSQSALHPSFALLLGYRYQVRRLPCHGYIWRFELQFQATLLRDPSGSRHGGPGHTMFSGGDGSPRWWPIPEPFPVPQPPQHEPKGPLPTASAGIQDSRSDHPRCCWTGQTGGHGDSGIPVRGETVHRSFTRRYCSNRGCLHFLH